ncbi:MAG: DTW domain-containing protein [Opitutaceae bacterium]|nr:DTW domain-containing protein [Opitutaceae bacterium]
MARSVVLKGGPRCERCRQAHRWCVCDGSGPVHTPVALEVLQHSNEVHKPTSTGGLLLREVAGARQRVYCRGEALVPSAWQLPDRELWFLHPNGVTVDSLPAPEALQVVLLDASWSQARLLERECDGVGRRVALPMTGESRYWLRTQNGEGRFSTAEAFLFLLRLLGLNQEADLLSVRFERHVYAGLRARGKLDEARRYVETSSHPQVFDGFGK